MSLSFLRPVEHFGARFDRAMTLYEFSALREPEATQFPKIGAWLRARGVEFNEVPTPQMLWRGKLWPDLFIANQLDAVPEGWSSELLVADSSCVYPPERKRHWPDDWPLDVCSIIQHGSDFHETFIEPICEKISGKSSEFIAAKFHRALWLPIYHAPTLRARKSLPTKFHYPRAGFSGAVASVVGHGPSAVLPAAPGATERYDATTLGVAYVLASQLSQFSVAFVVDPSPIYRVTDMDVCAGTVGHGLHRLIVEYRGECDVLAELPRLGLGYVHNIAYGSMRMEIPTLANAARGWKPRPHLNAQLMEVMNDN